MVLAPCDARRAPPAGASARAAAERWICATRSTSPRVCGGAAEDAVDAVLADEHVPHDHSHGASVAEGVTHLRRGRRPAGYARDMSSTGTSIEELAVCIRARYTLIYLLSFEEQRVLEEVQRLAARERKRVVVWSFPRGARGAGVQASLGQKNPIAMLDAAPSLPEGTLLVLLDFHAFLGDPAVVRRLKELAQELEPTTRTVLILSPVLRLPVELSKEIMVIDFALPDAALLAATLREITASLPPEAIVGLTADDREQLVRSAQGLTVRELANVLAKTLVVAGRIDRGAVAEINREKKQIIRKSGSLEYYPVAETMEQIGGLELLKAWLVSRGQAFSERARAFGLPYPKGILIVGVQGCGKSLTAKAVASEWQLPLLKLDMGRLFSGTVGSSEEHMRHAITLAEAVAPAVLWIDELEKGLAGLGSSNLSDGGTTARVIGTFLTWLQEKQQAIFVIATCNDITALPPELLRKGRFDEIFFVDLPTHAERRAIFAIHIARRGRRPEDHDLDALAAATRGYSGAEIEGAVVAGLFGAFEAGRELGTEDILVACRETVPLSVLLEEKIVALREWGRLRTRRASAGELAIESSTVDPRVLESLRRLTGDN
jgi:SpoVK/Ycf46/Vps4 family AAA+-type ATPase